MLAVIKQAESYCSNLSNFNYKQQVESRQQHLALYMDRHLHSLAIMIEVTSRHTECTHFNLDYSRMPPVALQYVYSLGVYHLQREPFSNLNNNACINVGKLRNFYSLSLCTLNGKKIVILKHYVSSM